MVSEARPTLVLFDMSIFTCLFFGKCNRHDTPYQLPFVFAITTPRAEHSYKARPFPVIKDGAPLKSGVLSAM